MVREMRMKNKKMKSEQKVKVMDWRIKKVMRRVMDRRMKSEQMDRVKNRMKRRTVNKEQKGEDPTKKETASR